MDACCNSPLWFGKEAVNLIIPSYISAGIENPNTDTVPCAADRLAGHVLENVLLVMLRVSSRIRIYFYGRRKSFPPHIR